METRLSELTRYRVIPVVVVDDSARAADLGRALVDGGLPIAEVTLRTPAAADAIAAMTEVSGLLVGAGTVLTAHHVEMAAAMGAQFVVSPGLNEAVVLKCQELDLPVVPGAVTATEIQAALALGLDVVKFFPAETSGGAAAIQALAAPFEGVSFIPTGGVGPANLADYLALPCVAAVGGSWMVPRQAIANGDWATIAELSHNAVEVAAK